MLVGVFVLIDRGSIYQLVIGSIFCACYLLLQLHVEPFMQLVDNYLASGCSFALLMFFLCCIVLKVGTVVELHDVQAVLSSEQKRDLNLPSVMLTGILFASVVGALEWC